MSSWLLGRLAARLARGGSRRIWTACLGFVRPLRLRACAVSPHLGAARPRARGAARRWPAGRLLARLSGADVPPWALERVQRRGAPALLLSWLPFVGDALCVAAGWLGVRALPALAFIAAGKAARYAVLLALAP